MSSIKRFPPREIFTQLVVPILTTHDHFRLLHLLKLNLWQFTNFWQRQHAHLDFENLVSNCPKQYFGKACKTSLTCVVMRNKQVKPKTVNLFSVPLFWLCKAPKELQENLFFVTNGQSFSEWLLWWLRSTFW